METAENIVSPATRTGEGGEGRSGSVLTRVFEVSWLPGLIVSRFRGSFEQPPEYYALDLQQMHEAFATAIAQMPGSFVSLIDWIEVGPVHGEFAGATMRMLRHLPRAPEKRALVVGHARFSRIQSAIIRAATLGRVQIFELTQRDEVASYLAEAGTVSETAIGSLWP